MVRLARPGSVESRHSSLSRARRFGVALRDAPGRGCCLWPGRELGHVSAEPKVLYPAEGQGTGIGRAGSGSGEPHALTRNGGGEYNL